MGNNKDDSYRCKGSWDFGTACGKCKVCIDTKPVEHKAFDGNARIVFTGQNQERLTPLEGAPFIKAPSQGDVVYYNETTYLVTGVGHMIHEGEHIIVVTVIIQRED